MLLVIDVGNTNIVYGLFDGVALVERNACVPNAGLQRIAAILPKKMV